jgi:hypothetical protein
MWIIAASLEILSAHDTDQAVVPLVDTDRARLSLYTRVGVDFISARTIQTQSGGFSFDLGAWDDYTDDQYAQYTGAAFPVHPVHPPIGTTWDVSHGARFVPVFDTIDRVAKTHTGLPATRGFSKMLASQWVHVVANLSTFSCHQPYFRNFFGGDDGWYCVRYVSALPGHQNHPGVWVRSR